MIILGIETSCDETALALIETRFEGNMREYRVIQSLVHSQAELHSAYGGVFPTLAKREHSKNLLPLLKKILADLPVKETISDEALAEKISEYKKEFGEQNADLMEAFDSGFGIQDSGINTIAFLKNIPIVDKIAVTEGPGLEPALWVGITFARILGNLWNVPVVPVNHMEGHIVGSLLESDKASGSWQKLKELPLPAVALLISGGHTELIQINKIGDYKIIGQTKDDVVGEAFDKAARLLGLPYPGGPHISKLANEAREQNIQSQTKLPRPMLHSKDLNFSFSGLKTAVLYAVRDEEQENSKSEIRNPNENFIISNLFQMGLARELEDSIADVLDSKLRSAIEDIGAQSIIIGGGVSANHTLRERFTKTANKYDIPIFLPSHHISGDNALMIALAGSLNEKPPTDSRGLRAHGTMRLA